MIANQIQQLRHQATELTRLPMSLTSELNQLWGEYQALMRQAQGITYQYGAVKSQVEGLYNQARNMNPAGVMNYAAQLASQLRSATNTAMESQAIVEKLQRSQAAVQRAIAASEGAVGNLQVEQAGNQLQAAMAQQQAGLIELIAASNRAEASWLGAQAALDEMARRQAQESMRGWGKCTNCERAGVQSLPALH
jgi:P-type conjugative transfer protein TrbJ